MTAPDPTPRVDTAAIRALADAATEGPWIEHYGDVLVGEIPATAKRSRRGYAMLAELATNEADAAFIAAARTAVPALCDEVDRLRAVVEAVEAFSEHVERAGRVYGYAVAHDLRATIASVTGGAR